MTGEEHNKTLATLYYIYGAMHGLTLVGLLLLVLAVKWATPDANLIFSLWLVVGAITFVALFLMVGLLPLVVGYGFTKRARWVKAGGQALAIVSLLNIPVGTALGIYTLKFFRSPDGVMLYGGKSATANERELQDALRGAQPLVNWTNRSKS